MGELGNIFDAHEDASEKPRGPDLRTDVCVPRSALGREGGYVADVPDELEHEGKLVPRVRGPGEAPGKIALHLPEGFSSGSVLRLRRQGGRVDEGVPGDLFLRIEVVDAVDSGVTGLIVVFVIALLAGLAVWALAAP